MCGSQVIIINIQSIYNPIILMCEPRYRFKDSASPAAHFEDAAFINKIDLAKNKPAQIFGPACLLDKTGMPIDFLFWGSVVDLDFLFNLSKFCARDRSENFPRFLDCLVMDAHHHLAQRKSMLALHLRYLHLLISSATG